MKRLEIGAPAPVITNPVNTFQIIVSQMSGDADVFQEEDFDFKDEVDAIEFLEVVNAIKDMQYGGYMRKAKEVQERLASVGKIVSTDDIYDICGMDVTCEDFLACVDDVVIVYYNDYGTKFYVTLEND